MRPQALLLIAVLVAAAGWWLLRESPEEAVRAAHAELAERLGKTADEGVTPSVRDIMAYQSLFADPTTVAGAAEGFVGSYTPDEMAGLIVRVRGLFATVELAFSEPDIRFPDDDEALAVFSATLRARRGTDEAIAYDERREVTSRMRRIDGEWLFAEFRFVAGPEQIR